MLYDPAWEKVPKKENGIRKRSLMDVVKKLKPKNSFGSQKLEFIKKKKNLKSDGAPLY
jgi:hypothetical protein